MLLVLRVAAAAAVAMTSVLGVVPATSAVDAASASLPARWVHHVDVNGDGVRDRVTLVPGHDLVVRSRAGTGHFRVRVRLSTGAVAVRSMRVDFYYPPNDRPWSPWFGAAQIDHRGGRELVLGRAGGAHTTVYSVVTWRPQRLWLIRPPDALPVSGPGWVVNTSAGTGGQGWQCTATGVRSRSAVPRARASEYIVTKRMFTFRHVTSPTWHLTHRVRRVVNADRASYLLSLRFAAFDCPGLPDRAL